MANLKEIKLKIGSVKNTQKTTKAMKLVSSAKLTRTRQLSEQARSYAVKINEVLSDIAARVSKAHEGGNISRAFVKNDNPKTVDIVFVTADKGLCGGFNMATIKTVSKMITEYKSQGINVRLRAAGKKGVEYFTFQKFSLEQRISDLSSAPDYDRAADFINAVVEDFRNEVTDKVVLVYNGFLNMLSQEIRVRELLPIGLENIEVKNILIATGSVPAMPQIKGAELTINSDELLNDENVYEQIAIIGGGVIGIEFAFLYASLGKRVIILEALDRILANMDKEFAQSLKMLLSKRNVEIQTKALVQEISYNEGTKKYNCKYLQKDAEYIISADKVLMAVGRRAYTQNLFADNLSIETDRGKIKVNENYQTNIENIYASGDVIGGIQLAHVATAEAINAVCYMLGRVPIYNMKLIPSCIYTNPEIASIGMTLDEAKAQGINVKTIKYPMGANGKTVLSLQERGFIKIIVDKETDCILGAQMMCAHATDMISQFTQAIQQELTLADLQKIIFPHPTFNEAIGKAVE